MKFLVLIFILFVSACTSTQGLSIYSFSNADVASAINNQLPKLSKKVSVIGLPVQFDVKDVNVDIGPDNRDVVVLGVDASAKINAFALSYPVGLVLQVEGSPFYDSEKNAIFLRNVKLLDSRIDAAGFRGNLGVLDTEAMNVINAFLEVNPVYTLNMHDPKMALLSKLPLDIKVVQGAMRLTPRL